MPADDISKNKKPSDRLVTLLTAYTLCKEAIDYNRVLKDHVTESMFHAGIIAYYSIFKNKDCKKWLEDILLGRKLANPPWKTFFRVRHGHVKEDGNIGRYYFNVFEKFESIRDKNIAHKDPERALESKLEWLQIPNGVASSDVLDDGVLYMTHYVFLSLDNKDKLEFLDLVGISIDILWQKEGLKIHRREEDGSIHPVDPPKLKC